MKCAFAYGRRYTEEIAERLYPQGRDAYIKEAEAARLDAERWRIQQAASDAFDAYHSRRGKKKLPFRVEVEMVLHAHGAVEVAAYRDGVYARGVFGRSLRDDEVCEILQQAERILRDTRLYRAEVAWNREPPVLYVAAIPAMVGFGL